MRTLRYVSVATAAALLAACSDSPVSPAATSPTTVPKVTFAVNDLTNNTPEVGLLKICKAGNVGGTFVVTDVDDGEGGTGNPTIQSPITVANGTCRIAAEDNGDANQSKGDFFAVSENAAANTVQVLTSCVGLEGVIPCDNNYFVNNVHGVVLTYTNTFTPPDVSGGSITLQGGRFTLLKNLTTNALSGSFSIANTSGSKQSVNIISAAIVSAVANIGGGNQISINVTGCSITPIPVIIAPDQTQLFTVSGCDLSQALAGGNELNITVRAVVNGGSQPFYERTYTVKAQ